MYNENQDRALHAIYETLRDIRDVLAVGTLATNPISTDKLKVQIKDVRKMFKKLEDN